MDKPRGIDCVLVGPHEVDFGQYSAGLRAMGEDAIAYRMLKTNSTVLDGQRMTYFDMLNRFLADDAGVPADLHVYKLPNLAIAHLKTALHRAGLVTGEVNFFTQERDLLADLLERDPLAVAITSTFYVDNDALTEVVGFIRRHAPRIPVIVGGPHILNVCSTYDPQAQDFIFQSIGADIYIHDAQGEAALAQVVHALRKSGRSSSGSRRLPDTSTLRGWPAGPA